MKSRLFSASLSVRVFAADRFLMRRSRLAYYPYVACRRIANGLEDLSRGRLPRFGKED